MSGSINQETVSSQEVRNGWAERRYRTVGAFAAGVLSLPVAVTAAIKLRPEHASFERPLVTGLGVVCLAAVAVIGHTSLETFAMTQPAPVPIAPETHNSAN